MEYRQTVCVAPGDGIGPEIMAATLHILKAARARVDFEEVCMGQAAYAAGYPSGIRPETWRKIRQHRILLKAPVFASPDSRYKSPHVIVRKMLGMYANIRPCVSYAPFVQTRYPGLQVVIIRENEEDLYAGIEHRQTAEVTQSTRLISRPGAEKIIRYAFEYARAHYRRKVTCFTKDSLMKLTDGLFHQVFNRIALEYPDIEHEHWVVDVGTARLADSPEHFDVLVTPNLYGDILNDMTAQLAGSIGMAGSANVGGSCAMFETVHGAVPHRAGLDQANPSGLLLAAVMMLNHIGQPDIAEWIHNAWLKTLEDGLHTYDIFVPGQSQQLLGTTAFAEAVVERLGQEPAQLAVRYEKNSPIFHSPPYKRPHLHKQLVGVDVFLDYVQPSAAVALPDLLRRLQSLPGVFQLKSISNRGVTLWPEGPPEIFCTDHWRVRFQAERASQADLLKLMVSLDQAGLQLIKTEHLYTFDGEPGFLPDRPNE